MTIAAAERTEQIEQAERDLVFIGQNYVMLLRLVTDDINAFIADTETERKAELQRQALKFRRNINRDIKLRQRLVRLSMLMPTLNASFDVVLERIAEAVRHHEKALRIALKIAETAEDRPPDDLMLNVSGLVGYAISTRQKLAAYEIQRSQLGMFRRKMMPVTERELDVRAWSIAGDRERIEGNLRVIESWKPTLKPQFESSVAEVERTLRQTLKVLDEVEVTLTTVRKLTVDAEIAARQEALLAAG